MDSVASFVFVYSTGSSYISVESDVSKGILKIGCLGMAPIWGISDHTWDYALTYELASELDSIVKDSGFCTWDECYASADEPDMQWEFIITDASGEKKRSFGNGMRSERLDYVLGRVKEIVISISKEVYIDLSSLEAVYFCHVANKVNLTCTLYHDMESVFELTGIGEKKFILSPAQWDSVSKLVSDPSLDHFGFRKDAGTQFLSIALYLGGKMVSFTHGGSPDKKWDLFQDRLLRILEIA